MKNINPKPDPLAQFLQETGLDQPTPRFAERLKHIAIHSYKRKYAQVYKKEERLGKVIIGILVFFNLFMLYRLSPFTIEPEIGLCTAAFVIGLWALVILSKKIKTIPYK